MGSSIVMIAMAVVAQAAAPAPKTQASADEPRPPRSSTTRSGSCGTAVTPRRRKPWRRLKPRARKDPAGLNSALEVDAGARQGRVSGQSG